MKPNILLIGDDIRYPTGVGNICKELITRTLDKYNWIQIANKQNHPESGKIIDVSKSISERYKVDDCYVRLYCSNGYGDEQTLFGICENEKIDAVIHITDPRFYKWLYSVENKLRKTTPLCYYHVWDNYPIPTYNRGVYLSCDWIGCISQLTYDVVTQVTDGEVFCEYVPHGVDTSIFTKIDNASIKNARESLLEEKCKFAVLCNNVNMRRKQLPTSIEGFSKFYNTISESDRKHTLLMLHTNSVGEGGHDLIKLVNDLYPEVNVLFSTSKVTPEILNQMYNTFSVTLNTASNEGFGLSTLESLSAGTPIICNKTGGLKDQIDKDNTWGLGLEPSISKLSGDGSSPYLYEDYVSADSVASAILTMYNKTEDELDSMGKLGRSFVEENFKIDRMINGLTNGIDYAIANFKPSPKYRFNKVS
jgi:glycosyltransferase involved in cell wall biosynthesis